MSFGKLGETKVGAGPGGRAGSPGTEPCWRCRVGDVAQRNPGDYASSLHVHNLYYFDKCFLKNFRVLSFPRGLFLQRSSEARDINIVGCNNDH